MEKSLKALVCLAKDLENISVKPTRSLKRFSTKEVKIDHVHLQLEKNQHQTVKLEYDHKLSCREDSIQKKERLEKVVGKEQEEPSSWDFIKVSKQHLEMWEFAFTIMKLIKCQSILLSRVEEDDDEEVYITSADSEKATKRKAKEMKITWVCVSISFCAKTCVNVEQCFEELVLKILETPSLLAEGSAGLKKNTFECMAPPADASTNSYC
ncbi:hypothetical protein IEQ34_004777 [Dendrobium chrysotoxum]|uniref:Uncharacterized protein n=1 Tax=Dendrobium chrysotoxum TaxID=161865 RepID=A0AAV7HAG7_DENCH|nr:hypothetical protein IEQ34_004777 [Dendrobium chrysotoxum]